MFSRVNNLLTVWVEVCASMIYPLCIWYHHWQFRHCKACKQEAGGPLRNTRREYRRNHTGVSHHRSGCTVWKRKDAAPGLWKGVFRGRKRIYQWNPWKPVLPAVPYWKFQSRVRPYPWPWFWCKWVLPLLPEAQGAFCHPCKKHRNVIYDGQTCNFMDVALRYKGAYLMDFKDKKGRAIQYKMSCIPVRLCEFPSKELVLTAVYGFGEEPMLLLSSLKMQEKKSYATSKI